MSCTGWAEFLCGPLPSEHARIAVAIVTVRIPFQEDDAELAAYLFNQSGRKHQKRGSMLDCMIAATALSRDAPLATSNVEDFKQFEPLGLKLIRPKADVG